MYTGFDDDDGGGSAARGGKAKMTHEDGLAYSPRKRTDKFIVTGYEAIDNQYGSFRDIRGALTYFVGETVKKDEMDASVAFKDVLREASIYIGQDKIWDPKDIEMDPADPFEWSEATKKRFAAVRKALETFNGGLKDVTRNKESLQTLNEESIRAVSHMMYGNYRYYDGEDYNQFTYNMYTDSEHADISISREGLKFTLRYKTTIYSMVDEESCCYELDTKGQIRPIEPSKETFQYDKALRERKFVLFDTTNGSFLQLTSAAEREEAHQRKLARQRSVSKWDKPAPCDVRIEKGQYVLYDVNSSSYFAFLKGKLQQIPFNPTMQFVLYDTETQCLIQTKPAFSNIAHSLVASGRCMLFAPANRKFYVSNKAWELKEVPTPNYRRFLLFDQERRTFCSLPNDCSVMNLLHPGVADGAYMIFGENTRQFYVYLSKDNSKLQQVESPLRGGEEQNLDKMLQNIELLPVWMSAEMQDLETMPVMVNEADFEPRAVLEYETMPIADVLMVAELDLSSPHRLKATIAVDITTHSPLCRLIYVGGRYAPEIIQLQNARSSSGSSAESSPMSSSRSSRSYERTRKDSHHWLTTGLSRSTLKLGSHLSELRLHLQGKEDFGQISKDDWYHFFTGVVHVFNESIRAALMKLFAQSALSNEGLEDTQLQELMRILKSGETFEDLMDFINRELQHNLSDISPKELAQLVRICRSMPFTSALESALYLVRNPKIIQTQTQNAATVERASAKAFVIWNAMLALNKAVSATAAGYQLHEFNLPEHASVTIQNDRQLLMELVHYMCSSFNNLLQDNPFTELLAHHKVITDASRSIREADHEVAPFQRDGASEDNVRSSLDADEDVDLLPYQPRSGYSVHLVETEVPIGTRRVRLAKRERIAKLCEINPVLQALNDLSVRYAILQFLKLYPEAYGQVVPWAVFVEMAASSVGAAIGTYAVTHPNYRDRTMVRFWKAGTDGLVVNIFSFNIAINVYLAIHPQNGHVTNMVFWTQLAPAPLIFAGLYTLWDSISEGRKQRWFGRHPGFRKGIDVGAKFAFYGGAMSMLMMNIVNSPGELWATFVPLIPAFGGALMHLTRFKDTAHAVMSYIIGGNFVYMMARDLGQMGQETDPIPTWSHAIRIGYWSLLTLASIGIMIKYSTRFVREYDNVGRFTVAQFPTGTVDSQTYPHLPAQMLEDLQALEHGTVDNEREPLLAQQRAQRVIAFAYEQNRARQPDLRVQEDDEDFTYTQRDPDKREGKCIVQ